MKKIKVVQIGAAHDHAWVTLESMLMQSDVFEVMGWAVPDDEKDNPWLGHEKFKDVKRYSVDEALSLPGLDAAVIETAEKSLTEYALLAAQKGFSVHVDKPGSPCPETFERLVETARKNRTVLHMGYMYRYNPEIIALKERIRKGELGEIYSIEAHMSCIHPEAKRNWLEGFPGGMMFFLGCHLIDIIYSIQGKPQNIIPLNKCTGIGNVEKAEDLGMAVFIYKNGISFAKSCACEIGGFHRRQLVVCGSKGTEEIRPIEWYDGEQERELCTHIREYSAENAASLGWHDAGCERRTASYDRYNTMMRAFAGYVAHERENPFGYDYELELFKLLLKACGK